MKRILSRRGARNLHVEKAACSEPTTTVNCDLQVSIVLRWLMKKRPRASFVLLLYTMAGLNFALLSCSSWWAFLLYLLLVSGATQAGFRRSSQAIS
jgi:hypothetical protein